MAFAHHRCGALTEFRHSDSHWDLDFRESSADAWLWHGGHDTNVPLEDVRRFASHFPSARLQVVDDAVISGRSLEASRKS